MCTSYTEEIVYSGPDPFQYYTPVHSPVIKIYQVEEDVILFVLRSFLQSQVLRSINLDS